MPTPAREECVSLPQLAVRTSLYALSLLQKGRGGASHCCTSASHLCTFGFESLHACIALLGISLDRLPVLGSAYGKVCDRFLEIAPFVPARPLADFAPTPGARQANAVGVLGLQLPSVADELLLRLRLAALRALLPIAVIARAGRGFFRQLPLICRK